MVQYRRLIAFGLAVRVGYPRYRYVEENEQYQQPATQFRNYTIRLRIVCEVPDGRIFSRLCCVHDYTIFQLPAHQCR